MRPPLVSIAMVTYNHRPFISDALDGVLKQQIPFSCELCIGDDGSTDGTTDIIRETLTNEQRFTVRHVVHDRAHPERENYRPVFMYNILKTLESCRGKYIAYLECDDYWTDPEKLKRQIAFMEKEPEYSADYHQAVCANDIDGSEVIRPELAADCDFDVRSWPRITLPTCGLVVRRDAIQGLFAEPFRTCAGFDVPLLFLVEQVGKIRLTKGTMGCYRLHAGGQWSGRTAEERYGAMVNVMGVLLKNVVADDKQKREWVQTLLSYNLIQLAAHAADSDRFRAALKQLVGSDALRITGNEWIISTACSLLSKKNDELAALRQSRSFRYGRLIVETARRVLHPFRSQVEGSTPAEGKADGPGKTRFYHG